MPAFQTIGREFDDAIAVFRGGVVVAALQRYRCQPLQRHGGLRSDAEQFLRIFTHVFQVARFGAHRDQVREGLFGIRLGLEQDRIGAFGFIETTQQLQRHRFAE